MVIRHGDYPNAKISKRFAWLPTIVRSVIPGRAGPYTIWWEPYWSVSGVSYGYDTYRWREDFLDEASALAYQRTCLS